MKKLIFIPAICVVMACSNHPKKDVIDNSQTKTADSGKKAAAKDRVGNMQNMRDKLIGIWADSVGGNPIFQIDKKTFFYVDNEGRYDYKFIGDSLQVHYDGYYQSFGWKFKGDNVLVLTGPDGVTPFYRTKE